MPTDPNYTIHNKDMRILVSKRRVFFLPWPHIHTPISNTRIHAKRRTHWFVTTSEQRRTQAPKHTSIHAHTDIHLHEQKKQEIPDRYDPGKARTRRRRRLSHTMKGSFSEANLPTLPGIRKYTPKRTTWGRMKYFDISADGVMLEARPASSPSRDQASLEASRLRRSQSMSRSMLRPLSATEMRMSDSVQSLQDAMQDADIPARLSRTIRKKEEVVANIRQLDPLTINQRRVALQKELKDLETAEKSILKENLAPQAAGIKPSRSQLALTNPPDWVKYDRQVLRYYVYFKEAVPESAQETYRIRKGILLYFLADKTMSLTEPRIVNSGLAQGEFYKRGPMVDPRTGQAYQPSDFKIGGEIKVLSTVYRIVDMDVQTRKYHQSVLGQRVPEAEAYPENPIDARMKFSDLNRMKNPKLSRRITNEALLGGRPGLFGYPIIKSVEGKDDIQGKILRFRGIWDDSEVLYGARNEYNIQYFLEDDEVEIRKRRGGKKAGSSVKEPTLVLKKSRLPRDFTVKDNDMPDKPLGRNEEKYYTEKDFILGNYINFYGRDVLLTWCDKETERYFKERHGIQQVSSNIANLSSLATPAPS